MAKIELDMKFEAFKFLAHFLERFFEAQGLDVRNYTREATGVIHESSKDLGARMTPVTMDTISGRFAKRDPDTIAGS